MKLFLTGLSIFLAAWSVFQFAYCNMVADAIYYGVGAVWVLSLRSVLKRENKLPEGQGQLE